MDPAGPGPEPRPGPPGPYCRPVAADQAPTDGSTSTATTRGSRLSTTLSERWRTVLLLVLALVALPNVLLAAVVFDDLADTDGLYLLDQPTLEQAVDGRTPTLDRVVLFYSELGGPVPAIVLTALAVVGLSLLWKTWTPFLLMLIAGAGSLAMSMTSKNIVDRERPPEALIVGDLEPSFSFPSGHALNATIIAGVLAYLFISRTRSWKVAAVAVPLAVLHTALMGLSRVYLGQHWLSDVVVAWFMSLAWLTVILAGHQVLVRVTGGTLRRSLQGP